MQKLKWHHEPCKYPKNTPIDNAHWHALLLRGVNVQPLSHRRDRTKVIEGKIALIDTGAPFVAVPEQLVRDWKWFETFDLSELLRADHLEDRELNNIGARFFRFGTPNSAKSEGKEDPNALLIPNCRVSYRNFEGSEVKVDPLHVLIVRGGNLVLGMEFFLKHFLAVGGACLEASIKQCNGQVTKCGPCLPLPH